MPQPQHGNRARTPSQSRPQTANTPVPNKLTKRTSVAKIAHSSANTNSRPAVSSPEGVGFPSASLLTADLSRQPSAAKRMIVQLTTKLDSIFESENKVRKQMLTATERAGFIVAKLEDLDKAQGDHLDTYEDIDARECVKILLSKANELSTADRWAFMETTLKLLIKSELDFQQFQESYLTDAHDRIIRDPLVNEPDTGEQAMLQPPVEEPVRKSLPTVETTEEEGESNAELEAANDAEEDAKVDKIEFEFKMGTITHLECLLEKITAASLRVRARANWRDAQTCTYPQLKDRVRYYERRTIAAQKILRSCEKQVDAAKIDLETVRTRASEAESVATDRTRRLEQLAGDLIESRKKLLSASIGANDCPMGPAVQISSPVLDESIPPPSGLLAVVSVLIWDSLDHLGGVWKGLELADVTQALQLYNDLLRTLSLEFQGYEAFAEGDHSIFVFRSVADAVGFACRAQLALLTASWPTKLIGSVPCCGVEYDPEITAIVWRGLRVGMIGHYGEVFSEIAEGCHRTKYYGYAMDVVRALRTHALGGELLITENALGELSHGALESIRVTRHITVEVHPTITTKRYVAPCGTELSLFRAYPVELAAREYLPYHGSIMDWEAEENVVSSEQVGKVLHPPHRRWDFCEWASERKEILQARIAFIQGIQHELDAQRPPPHMDPPTGNRLAVVISSITNIETAWKHDKEAVREMLSAHNRLVRDLLHSFSGYESKSEGDMFVCVFRQPRDALRFALAMQEDLLHMSCPDRLIKKHDGFAEVIAYDENDNAETVWHGPRVRIGIHSADQHCTLHLSHDPGAQDFSGDDDPLGISTASGGVGLDAGPPSPKTPSSRTARGVPATPTSGSRLSAKLGPPTPGGEGPKISSHVSYTGGVLDQALGLWRSALGGEIVISKNIYASVRAELSQCGNPVIKEIKDYRKGPEPTYRVLPSSLAGRLEDFTEQLPDLLQDRHVDTDLFADEEGSTSTTPTKLPNMTSTHSELVTIWNATIKKQSQQMNAIAQASEVAVRFNASRRQRPLVQHERQCIVVIDIYDRNSALLSVTDQLKDVLSIYYSVIRTQCKMYDVHEVDCNGTECMLAFPSTHLGLQFTRELINSMKLAMWPDDALTSPHFEIVKDDQNDKVLLRGPRIVIGLDCGQVDVSRKNPDTGFPVFVGPGVDKARQLCQIGSAYDVVLSEEALGDIKHKIAEMKGCQIEELGRIAVPGFEKKEEVVAIIPEGVRVVAGPRPFSEGFIIHRWWHEQEASRADAQMRHKQRKEDALFANERKERLAQMKRTGASEEAIRELEDVLYRSILPEDTSTVATMTDKTEDAENEMFNEFKPTRRFQRIANGLGTAMWDLNRARHKMIAELRVLRTIADQPEFVRLRTFLQREADRMEIHIAAQAEVLAQFSKVVDDQLDCKMSPFSSDQRVFDPEVTIAKFEAAAREAAAAAAAEAEAAAAADPKASNKAFLSSLLTETKVVVDPQEKAARQLKQEMEKVASVAQKDYDDMLLNLPAPVHFSMAANENQNLALGQLDLPPMPLSPAESARSISSALGGKHKKPKSSRSSTKGSGSPKSKNKRSTSRLSTDPSIAPGTKPPASGRSTARSRSPKSKRGQASARVPSVASALTPLAAIPSTASSAASSMADGAELTSQTPSAIPPPLTGRGDDTNRLLPTVPSIAVDGNMMDTESSADGVTSRTTVRTQRSSGRRTHRSESDAGEEELDDDEIEVTDMEVQTDPLPDTASIALSAVGSVPSSHPGPAIPATKSMVDDFDSKFGKLVQWAASQGQKALNPFMKHHLKLFYFAQRCVQTLQMSEAGLLAFHDLSADAAALPAPSPKGRKKGNVSARSQDGSELQNLRKEKEQLEAELAQLKQAAEAKPAAKAKPKPVTPRTGESRRGSGAVTPTTGGVPKTPGLLAAHRLLRFFFALLNTYVDGITDPKNRYVTDEEFLVEWLMHLRNVHYSAEEKAAKENLPFMKEFEESLAFTIETEILETDYAEDRGALLQSVVGILGRFYTRLHQFVDKIRSICSDPNAPLAPDGHPYINLPKQLLNEGFKIRPAPKKIHHVPQGVKSMLEYTEGMKRRWEEKRKMEEENRRKRVEAVFLHKITEEDGGGSEMSFGSAQPSGLRPGSALSTASRSSRLSVQEKSAVLRYGPRIRSPLSSRPGSAQSQQPQQQQLQPLEKPPSFRMVVDSGEEPLEAALEHLPDEPCKPTEYLRRDDEDHDEPDDHHGGGGGDLGAGASPSEGVAAATTEGGTEPSSSSGLGDGTTVQQQVFEGEIATLWQGGYRGWFRPSSAAPLRMNVIDPMESFALEGQEPDYEYERMLLTSPQLREQLGNRSPRDSTPGSSGRASPDKLTPPRPSSGASSSAMDVSSAEILNQQLLLEAMSPGESEDVLMQRRAKALNAMRNRGGFSVMDTEMMYAAFPQPGHREGSPSRPTSSQSPTRQQRPPSRGKSRKTSATHQRPVSPSTKTVSDGVLVPAPDTVGEEPDEAALFAQDEPGADLPMTAQEEPTTEEEERQAEAQDETEDDDAFIRRAQSRRAFFRELEVFRKQGFLPSTPSPAGTGGPSSSGFPQRRAVSLPGAELLPPHRFIVNDQAANTVFFPEHVHALAPHTIRGAPLIPPIVTSTTTTTTTTADRRGLPSPSGLSSSSATDGVTPSASKGTFVPRTLARPPSAGYDFSSNPALTAPPRPFRPPKTIVRRKPLPYGLPMPSPSGGSGSGSGTRSATPPGKQTPSSSRTKKRKLDGAVPISEASRLTGVTDPTTSSTSLPPAVVTPSSAVAQRPVSRGALPDYSVAYTLSALLETGCTTTQTYVGRDGRVYLSQAVQGSLGYESNVVAPPPPSPPPTFLTATNDVPPTLAPTPAPLSPIPDEKHQPRDVDEVSIDQNEKPEGPVMLMTDPLAPPPGERDDLTILPAIESQPLSSSPELPPTSLPPPMTPTLMPSDPVMLTVPPPPLPRPSVPTTSTSKLSAGGIRVRPTSPMHSSPTLGPSNPHLAIPASHTVVVAPTGALPALSPWSRPGSSAAAAMPKTHVVATSGPSVPSSSTTTTRMASFASASSTWPSATSSAAHRHHQHHHGASSVRSGSLTSNLSAISRRTEASGSGARSRK